ncbi:unnamed protein product, partial [Prorocentrum cordatum]
LEGRAALAPPPPLAAPAARRTFTLHELRCRNFRSGPGQRRPWGHADGRWLHGGPAAAVRHHRASSQCRLWSALDGEEADELGRSRGGDPRPVADVHHRNGSGLLSFSMRYRHAGVAWYIVTLLAIMTATCGLAAYRAYRKKQTADPTREPT